MSFRVSSFGLLVLLCFFLRPQYVEAAKPTIIFKDIATGQRNSENAARAYIAGQMRALNVSGKGSNIELEKRKHSLLGTHYYFQQNYKGIPIEDAEIVVSVRDNDAMIYRVFNNAVPGYQMLSVEEGASLSETQAYDIAWKDLGVSGPLMSQPSIKLVYTTFRDQMDLVYKIKLAVAEPFGYWQYLVSATSGKILKKEDTRLSRIAKKGAVTTRKRKGPLLERMSAFANFEAKNKSGLMIFAEEEATARADGKALVFDPDPRTALKDNTLQDNSPAEKFEAAYVNRVLKDLAFANGKYSLNGPWAQIQDFEPPRTAPSTTSDGNWSFKRGNNAFNDAMSYFHIDQSQRYIQSLGFSGDKGIQFRSIPIDSDGVNGDDNSHFVPGENRIAFGHGCVDDNEDSDVILHEYGHAMEDSIGNWHGGDTGAMGEGFGDYWAASYSMTTVNGWDFLPNNAFNWDGGGEGSPCWPGRRLDVDSAQYDPSRTYGAHQPMGGFESDELWSTPLFQSLRELMGMGYPRERVDQIILEAHFGLGANISMRDMGNAILQAAQKLYPNDPYASVFQKHFVHHNIVDVPHATLEIQQISLVNAGTNNVLDPGETVGMYVKVRNSGTLPAKSIKATVSSPNSNVTIAQGDFGYADLNAGNDETNTIPIMLTLSRDAVCGDEIALSIDFSFEGGASNSTHMTAQLATGVAKTSGGAVTHNPPLAIPDNKPAGVQSSLWLDDTGTIGDAKGVSLAIDLIHPYVGDLKVSLVSPSGKEVVLHNHTNSGYPNLSGTYPTNLTPAESFTKLAGELLKGEWKLKVADTAAYDKGNLKSWSLKVVSGYECTPPDAR